VFSAACRDLVETISKLATDGPNSLLALNRDFIKMCKAGAATSSSSSGGANVTGGSVATNLGGDKEPELPATMYSRSELVFYKGEVETLNNAIKEKKHERVERKREVEGGLPKR